MLNFINKYLGWRNWSVLYYNSIIENLFVLFYIVIIAGNYSNTFLLQVIFFLLFSIFSTTYGYLINDFADQELDRKHNKPNTFQNDGTAKAVSIIIIVFGLSIFSVLPFIGNKVFIFVWACWLFLATFYSLPPFRFKEKGKVGLILVVLAQRVFPVLMLFAAFQFDRIFDILIVLNLILARGFSSDINHQLQDYENDLKTNTNTSAVELGVIKFEKLFLIVLEYEKIAMIVVLGLISFNLHFIDFLNIPYFSIPIILYLTIYIIGILIILKKKSFSVDVINPYMPDKKDVFQVIHLIFPNIFLPACFLFYLIFQNPLFILFVVLIIIIYRLYNIDILKNSFLGKIIYNTKK